MDKDKKDDQAMKDQIAAEKAGLADKGAPARRAATTPGQPGSTDPEDLPDAPPGAPTPSVPHGAVRQPDDPDAPPQRPVNLPADPDDPNPPEPNPLAGSVSTLGQPTHVQPTKREQRGEHMPPTPRGRRE